MGIIGAIPLGILHQYLGNLVSILSFLIGGALMALSVPLIG